MELPEPYIARPYSGPVDHPAMASILREYRRHSGDPEMPTADQLDVTYANLTNCDPAHDMVIIESKGEPVGYARTSWEDLDEGIRDCIVFAPTLPAHLAEPLFVALVAAQERHMRPWADGEQGARFRAYAPHPGPGLPPTGEAAWLEVLGYQPIRFGASLVRPHLDDIPDCALPEGVEVRPVRDDMLRPIWEAHCEAFRGEWGSLAPAEEGYRVFLDNPVRDESLWKIAWVGDTVVGQVKSYINVDENEGMGYLRGYTEEISTHAEWRNRGIAGALLAMSLHELRSRGMTEAALGVDTQNPGGAFQLYTRLGFELHAYEAAYARPVH